MCVSVAACACRIVFNNGRVFKLYFQSLVSLTVSNDNALNTASMWTATAYTGTVRVAILSPGTQESLLDDHHDTYVTGGCMVRPTAQPSPAQHSHFPASFPLYL